MNSSAPDTHGATHPWTVVGESLVDIVVDQSGGRSSAVGGSPMNVAVGLARLDVPTLLITRIGDDSHGKRVAEHLGASGVTLSGFSVAPGTTTSTATARLGVGNAADYDFDLTWDLPRQHLPDTAGLHIGSLGASLMPGRAATLDLVRQAAQRESFVSYDPNIRPAFLLSPEEVWGEVVEIASLSTLVKVSDEDLDLLRPGEPPSALAHELLGGVRTELVILTAGSAGAAAHSGGLEVRVEAPAVEVVDTVGAGDSFMAAILALLFDADVHAGPGRLGGLDEQRLRTLLEGAATAAAVTCSRRGADPPTRASLPTSWPSVY